ncbi:MAG TPA: hypothetical protein VG123_22900 [Streptosporangiaceae bacterium]|nr:hypothetical protein [Streptosporangiaceae bacterium]
MSVYVGIDVHRKRSQVAVVSEDGTVELNRNVVNGSGPVLRLIGDLPSGTPVASGAAFGWGWLAGLLEDYGFEPHLVHPLRCKAIASARLENDKGRRRDPGAAAARGPAARGAGSPRRRCASSGRCCGTGPAWSGPAPVSATGSARSPPATATTGPQATGSGPGRGWLAEPGPAAGVAGDRDRLPGGDRWPGPGDRPDRRRAAPARQRRPAGHGAPDAGRGRGVHRAGHGGRDRRHHPVRQRPQAGLLGRADPDRARPRGLKVRHGHIPGRARRGCGG